MACLDTFKLKDDAGQDVPWTYDGLFNAFRLICVLGLMWEKDLKRFKNPELMPGESLCDAFNKVTYATSE